ncbi:MAG: hypothetical protein WCN95_04065 [bacterium]
MRQFHIKPPARGVSGWPARLVCMMLVSIVCHAAPENRDIDNAFVAPWELTLDDMNENVFELVHNRLELGIRISYVSLEASTRREYDSNGKFTRGFLGSIDRLEPEPGLTIAPFANVMFSDYIGMELTWQSLSVATYTVFDNHTDGLFSLSGPSCQIFFRLLNETAFTPRIGIGAVIFNTDFNEDTAWRLGFGTKAYQEWLDAGKPGGLWPNNGFVQVIDTSNTIGFMVTTGCQILLWDSVCADIDIRYIKTDVDGHYYMSQYGSVVDDRGITTFPMTALYVSCGIRYDF